MRSCVETQDIDRVVDLIADPEPGSPSPYSPRSPASPVSPLSPGPKTPVRELKAVKKQNLQLKTQLSALQKQTRAAE